PGLQTNNCLAAHPVAAGVKGVAGDHEHVRAIAGHPAVPPDSTTDSCCRPSIHVGRIVDIDAHNPAMVILTVTYVSGVGHVHDPIHKSQCPAFFLDQRIESHAIVSCGGVHIHWPARIGGACVHV